VTFKEHGKPRSLETTDAVLALRRSFSGESIGESLVATGDVPEALRHIREALAVFEAMAASGSKDRYVSSGLADCYFALGLAHSALAVNAKVSAAHKTKSWHEARTWYQKSEQIWNEKRTRGALDRSESETAERTARGIAKCDATLNNRMARCESRELAESCGASPEDTHKSAAIFQSPFNSCRSTVNYICAQP
jgi:hypothetical protein